MINNARPERKLFTDKADATERTLRALGNAGFTFAQNTDTINGQLVSTYSHSMGNRVTYRPGDRKPDIAAIYIDPGTKNQVTLGMNIAPGGDLRWPYDWSADAVRPATDESLARGGNHDSNQGEAGEQLVHLLGSAHFDVKSSRLPTWTPEYKEWEAGVVAQLDPLYSDSQSSQE